MLEYVAGRLINGALWGLAAGLVAAAVGEGRPGLRRVARRVVALGINAADRAQELTGGAREELEDLYAEARAEQVPQDGAKRASTTRRRRNSA